MRELLEAIGGVVRDGARAAFAQQAWEGEAWAPRGGSLGFNLGGLLADFAGGAAAPNASRFVGRPAGVDTGRLRSSLEVQVNESDASVQVVATGTAAEYAAIINDGGLHPGIPINDAMRRAARAWLETDPHGQEHTSMIRSALRKDEHAVESPPRQFLGITAAAEGQIARLVEEHFERGEE